MNLADISVLVRDLSILSSLNDCGEKEKLFADLITITLNSIMPIQTFKLHVNDQLWVTAEFKNLIKLRQRAFVKGQKNFFIYIVTVLIGKENPAVPDFIHPKSSI